TLSGGSGDVAITADPDSVSTTKALAGETAGAAFGLGLSIAVSVVDDTTTAFIGDLATISGAHNVSVSATGGHSSVVEAKKGAKAEDDASRTNPDSSKRTVDQDVSDQRDLGGKKATELSSGSGSKVSGAKPTPKAESSEKDSSGNSKPLQVAAAIAVTISVVSQKATIADGLTVASGGAMALSATGNTDSTAKADGSAMTTAEPTGTTVGAAIGVNLAFVTTEASVGAGAHVTGSSLALESRTRTIGTDSTNTYAAEATSGAGGGKNSVAGSLAFNLVSRSSTASIGAGTDVTITGVGTHDVSLVADPDSASTAKALSGGATAAKFGLGLSIAVSIVLDDVTAVVGDGATITGAHDLTIHASGGHALVTEG